MKITETGAKARSDREAATRGADELCFLRQRDRNPVAMGEYSFLILFGKDETSAQI